MEGGIANYLLTQGVLGFLCLLLIGALLYLQKKIDKLYMRIDDLQNLRLADSKEVAVKTAEVLSESSQTLRLLTEKIETGKRGRQT